MTVTMTSSVSVKTPISGQPATIEMLKADGSNWPTFANRFLGFLTTDQLEDLLELKSFKILVDADFEVVSLQQQEEMTDAQFKKLWSSIRTYKAKSCIRSIIKVVLPSAVASELLPVFSDATCVADAWALLRARFDKRSAQAHLANVKGLFTKPMSGSGAAAVGEHIADLQRRFDVVRRHERAKSSSHLRTDFADSFLILALLSSLPPEYSPTVLSLGERYEEMAIVELQTILEGAADQLERSSGTETQALVVTKRKDTNACHNCGKIGHYVRFCPNRDHQRKNGAETANWRKKKGANVVAKDGDEHAMFVHCETGDLLAKGVRHGDTWIVPGVCEKGPTKDARVLDVWGKRPVGAHVADAVKKVSLAELWHARRFHVGHDRVSAVCTLEHGIKDDVGVAKPLHECMTCLVANARSQPHPLRHLRANRLFGVLHADLVSMKTVGMGGVK
ncbi:hypothetical protein AMAG_20760 [Allomyces macrogynus ATCC 38327]|uniref:CCHC-type domain-containing protein n=1 Tax=Allomyces macrogynus (strain ATCC 38327) TaxID=578462 RepID=A0A0L0TFL2_ALLM3|nr:hypothetical protein AMAG_20760 [Allomyces macrogynus ATCC 38327]|eukprot:KNE73404.1 hypothetical protein AMAG_20760 [Allomyces macrogynus ATCC 38327]